jgi:hypothetical protein
MGIGDTDPGLLQKFEACRNKNMCGFYRGLHLIWWDIGGTRTYLAVQKLCICGVLNMAYICFYMSPL